MQSSLPIFVIWTAGKRAESGQLRQYEIETPSSSFGCYSTDKLGELWFSSETWVAIVARSTQV